MMNENIVAREDRWLEKYDQLKVFYQKHGHTRVTSSNCIDKSLVVWVGEQIRSCSMEDRIKLLKSIGFVFSASQQSEDRWQEKYGQLKEFYQKHGHIRVTYSYGANNSICKWVTNQRRDCKIENRKKLLNDVGCDWSPKKTKEDQWLENVNQLKEFYQKHGHTKVTYTNYADKSFVNWVHCQRRYCKIERRKIIKRYRV